MSILNEKIENEMYYDETNPRSIEEYSQRLVGMSFREVIEYDEEINGNILKEDAGYGISDTNKVKRNKGNLGQIIEERFFHYTCNNDCRPDFPKAGVELKVTPYKINKNGTLSAKERLIITMIDYFKVDKQSFEHSHLWQKSRLLLLVYYLYNKDVQFNVDYKIKYAKLFTPPEQDVLIIRHDYDVIASKVREGKAHELSESDTLYLGAAPKAATSKVRTGQPYSEIQAKPRAFAFKSSYMTYVLNTYIVSGKTTYEPIVSTGAVESFEDYVVTRIENYVGYSVEELCTKFNMVQKTRPKNLEALIAYRILGIKGNHAEEFEKANVIVKAIRIGKNNKIKESMSFPNFRFKELIKENWEDSSFGNYLRETRFLFVVYKYDRENVLRLKGCQFWNIPYDDLEKDVRSVWEQTKRVLIEGLQIIKRNGRNHDNFPKASDNRVSHVRPHARNAKDTYELPDGRLYPKQCFWLNNSYIYSQINDKLKG